MPEQPAWLALQRTVFTRFVSQQFRNAGKPVEIKSLAESFSTGHVLADLIQILSGNKLPGKREKNVKSRIKQLAYLDRIMAWIGQLGVDIKKIRVTNEDLANKNEQQVLALTYQIIVKFFKIEEGDEENLDLREALILWLKNKTQDYSLKISESKKGFVKSFHSGIVFHALIHKMRPKLVDMNDLQSDKAGYLHNLESALLLGEKYLNIPQYVKPSDVSKLDELSMIVYLSDWYFGITLLQKQDIAARRVGKLVDMTILHDTMRAEYLAQATQIDNWLQSKIADLLDIKFDDTLSGVRSLLEAFYSYKNTVKGAKVVANLDAEATFNNLHLRLMNHSRPAWSAGSGLDPSDLAQKFEELEAAEIKRSEALYTELARQIRLHKLFKRYDIQGKKLEKWVADNQQTVEKEVKIDSVEDAENALEELSMFVGQFGHLKTSSFQDLNVLAEELIRERFEHASEIEVITERVNVAFASMDECAAKRKLQFEADLQEQKDINKALCTAFAELAQSFNEWLTGKKQLLFNPDTEDLQGYYDALCAEASESTAAASKLEACLEAEAKITAREIERNPFTNLTSQDLQSQWNQFLILINKKKDVILEQIEEAKRAGLTEEQMAEINDNFAYFDSNGNNLLNVKELRTCLQSLGEESNKQVINEILAKYSDGKARELNKTQFVEYMKDRLGDTDTQSEIVRSFKHLCYDASTIETAQLTVVVNEKTFKDSHVAYLDDNISNGDYTTWTSEVFQR